MHWRIYTPTNGAPPPWPAIVDIHGGGYKSGHPFQSGPVQVAEELAARGYYVVSVDHELAPCGVMPTQHCHDSTAEGIASGRPPQQTDGIEAIVRALRADAVHCNGKIGTVGGSSGGSHAVWVALNTISSTGWPNWTEADRVTCAVFRRL